MGYDISRFVDCEKIIESFKCGICLDVLKEPVVVKACEHMYCGECIKDWMRTDTSCPQDRIPIIQRDIGLPSRFFRNLYENLEMKCDFVKDGCQTTMTLINLSAHTNNCEFNTVPCQNNCGFRARNEDFEHHNCVEYLKGELVKAKNALDLNGLAKREIEAANEALLKLGSVINPIARDQNRSLSLMKYFSEVTPKGTKNTFQWQWCKGFSEFEKERIISRISESIVYTHSTSPNEIAKFVQKLLKADLREKSLSVVIGHRKCLGTYVKFDKHLAVYVGNIKVVVFAKKT